jgi:transcriptional regulator with XRE-family HTH domain
MAQSYVQPRSTAAALLVLARLKAGISQRQLAERAGVPATMISAYERGRRSPTLGTLERLLKGAGLELRMRLAPLDPHDAVLASLEGTRSGPERRRRDAHIATWWSATEVE